MEGPTQSLSDKDLLMKENLPEATSKAVGKLAFPDTDWKAWEAVTPVSFGDHPLAALYSLLVEVTTKELSDFEHLLGSCSLVFYTSAPMSRV